MVNLECTLEVRPTQGKKGLTIRHTSLAQVCSYLSPEDRSGQGVTTIDVRTEAKIFHGQGQQRRLLFEIGAAPRHPGGKHAL